MSESAGKTVTHLLVNWRNGNEAALEALVPLVYNELRRVARHYLQGERPGHTLPSTALVHEAYMRLVDQGPFELKNRAHFFAVASQLMRQILVDYGRSRRAAKRGGGCTLALDENAALPNSKQVNLLELDAALDRLGRIAPRQSHIVELRFFGGLSIEETAQIVDASPATVKREWTTARAWLHRELKGSAQA